MYRYIIVEDEDLIAQNTFTKLTSLEFPLKFDGFAADGEKAVSLIESQHPQIVFTDIKMPVMDGLTLSKELYFAYPQIKIVIISGYDDFTFAKQAMKYGASDFLLKPIDIDELRETMVRIIAGLDTLKENVGGPIQSASTLSKKELADYAETFIKENYKENPSLREIGDKLGFSADYISKIFKKEKGITPIKFMTKLRINEAKLLLTSTSYDILTISQAIGYTDQFYFSRIFKQTTGVYPSEFRNAIL